jgi:hypothetical protein
LARYSRITCASGSFCNSSLTTSFLSADIFCTFCLCGLFSRSMRRWCSIMS